MSPRLLPLAALCLSLVAAPGCGPTSPADDDDSAGDDDDDATGDDDDSSGDDDDDDATGDDDDDDDSSGLACDDAALADALMTLGGWARLNSCGSFFSTATSDDDVRLSFFFSPWDSEPIVVGTVFEVAIGAAAPGDATTGSLDIQTGVDLSHRDCNDAILPGVETSVEATWTGVSGTFRVRATTDGEAKWEGGPQVYTGDVELMDIVVVRDGAEPARCAIPDTTWTGLAFGWLPG